MRGSKTDPARHSISDQMRFSLLVTESLMERVDQGSIMGVVGIQDMSGMTMGHASNFSPAIAKKAMTVFQASNQNFDL